MTQVFLLIREIENNLTLEFIPKLIFSLLFSYLSLYFVPMFLNIFFMLDFKSILLNKGIIKFSALRYYNYPIDTYKIFHQMEILFPYNIILFLSVLILFLNISLRKL
jgi:hypothetical protein